MGDARWELTLAEEVEDRSDVVVNSFPGNWGLTGTHINSKKARMFH